jgi:Protein of unknown function (DUF3154).
MGIADINIDGGLIKGAFEGVNSFIMTIRSAITGKVSPEAEASIMQEAIKIEAAINQAQAEINKIEAGSSSLFVAGWRPFIGWVCGFALAYNYVLMPFLVWTVTNFYPSAPTMPSLDVNELMTVLLGMLGLGAMRTYEKVKK